MDATGNGRHLKNPFSGKKMTKNRGRKSFTLIAILSIVVILLSSFFIVLVKHAYQLTPSDVYYIDPNEGGLKNSGSNVVESTSSTANNAPILKNSDSNTNNKAPVIAYAISLTSCSTSPSLVDGAATLAHSIHLNSVRNKNIPVSKYDYKLYAFFHTSIFEEDNESSSNIINEKDIESNKCASILQKIGYEVKVVDIPVPLNEIENESLREKLPKNGCCGEKEFIKIWSYTLTDHPFVVHLDIDTIILKPMDELFDYALHGTPLTQKTHVGVEEEAKKDVIMWNAEEELSTKNYSNVNAFFTRDYNMRPAGRKPVGVQGGFLILRPSKTVFEEFQSIIRKGDFHPSKGWGGLGYQFYGAMTFQGIIPYFYDIVHPNTAIELNRCVYNAMADNPRDKRTVNNKVSGNCRDGRKDCEDCRERGIEEVRTAHFTLCQKPWECLAHNSEVLQHKLCRKLFAEWYKVRADLELSWRGKSLVEEEKSKNGQIAVVGDGNFDTDQFRGFCERNGKKGYIPMSLPDV